MPEKRTANKPVIDFYARLDAIPMRELDRLHAKAQLERTEYVAELTVRVANAVRRLLRVRILRPICRAFGAS
jgi:hypothetical protein